MIVFAEPFVELLHVDLQMNPLQIGERTEVVRDVVHDIGDRRDLPLGRIRIIDARRQLERRHDLIDSGRCVVEQRIVVVALSRRGDEHLAQRA